ncbi:SDR family oxidoreductase [Streptomyces sp. URMC 126]|uniref:SDR family oxidoreductase n=1 Tax=Streptomyces sp. URMC 126 TaxID=3423401 RepID=UPI003F1BC75F
MPRHTVLITGAAGVVGTALLARLRQHHDIIVLTHRTPVDAPSLAGDITRPRLGLDADTYRTLARRVDTVVHSAAATGFRSDARHTTSVNVTGTEQVARFAVHAGARLIHISSAFTACSTVVRENIAAYAGAAGLPVAHYIDTKVAAEKLLADSDADVVILKPSMVVGDSRTGHLPTVQGLCGGFLYTLAGLVPFVPLAGATVFDVVPSDHVAQAVHIMTDPAAPSGTYWLTSGTASSTCARVTELIDRVRPEHGITGLPQAQCVEPAEALRRIGRLAGRPGTATTCYRLTQMLLHATAVNRAPAFPDPTVPGMPTPTPARTEAALRATLHHLARTAGPRLPAARSRHSPLAGIGT